MRYAVSSMIPGPLVAAQFFGRTGPLSLTRASMALVRVAQIRIALGLGCANLRGQGLRPFVPGKKAAFVQRERHAKGLGFPGFAEHGTVFVNRRTLQQEQIRWLCIAGRAGVVRCSSNSVCVRVHAVFR